MGTQSSLALRESRVMFRAFYTEASAGDAAAMDVLVKAYVSAMLGVLLPRKNLPDCRRMRIERDCDQAEREFLYARDRVRDSGTFRRLSISDQRRVATLFKLHLPMD